MKTESESFSLLDRRRKTSISFANILPSKSHTVLILFVSFFGGLLAGLTYSGSYLIEPVRSSCPSWSESATVYGEAGSLGVIAFTGMLAGALIRAYPFDRFFLASLLCSALSFGMSGVMLATCNSVGSSALQIVYIASLSLAGAAVSLSCLAVGEFCLSYLPDRGGAIGGCLMVGVTIGSIMFSQFFLKMQSLCRSKELDVATVFFLTGIVLVVTEIPFLFLVKRRETTVGIREPDQLLNKQPTQKKVIFTKTFWFLVVVRIMTLMPGFGLIARQQTVLETLWKGNPPIELLAFLAQAVFVIGAILPSLIADRFGPTHVWIFCLAFQTVCLGLLPWFIATSAIYGRYAGLVCYLLFNGAFAIPKALALGISKDFFGVRQATEGLGMLQLGYGGSGVLGPIISELMYMHYDRDYKPFLYLSACMSFVGLLAIILYCILR